MTRLEDQVSAALKSIARNEEVKAHIAGSETLYPLLQKAAKRYITGENRKNGIEIAKTWLQRGYGISLEYIGENTRNISACFKAKSEFLALLQEMGEQQLQQTVSLDLSHIGLSIDAQLAYNHLCELAEQALVYDITLMISMEESTKTDAIIEIFKNVSQIYSNVGITIQAHLYRTQQDIAELMHYPGKIRLVKGAYQEPADIAMPRSQALDRAYIQVAGKLIAAGHAVTIATHDAAILQTLEEHYGLNHTHVELEMLYGIRSDLLAQMQRKGYACQIYLLYGTEWFLYVCHRIAEHPENLYKLFLDMVQPEANMAESGLDD